MNKKEVYDQFKAVMYAYHNIDVVREGIDIQEPDFVDDYVMQLWFCPKTKTLYTNYSSPAFNLVKFNDQLMNTSLILKWILNVDELQPYKNCTTIMERIFPNYKLAAWEDLLLLRSHDRLYIFNIDSMRCRKEIDIRRIHSLWPWLFMDKFPYLQYKQPGSVVPYVLSRLRKLNSAMYELNIPFIYIDNDGAVLQLSSPFPGNDPFSNNDDSYMVILEDFDCNVIGPKNHPMVGRCKLWRQLTWAEFNNQS